MDEEMEATLRRLIGRHEITQLLYERGRLIDRLDAVGQFKSFTDDATTTFEGWHGTIKDFLKTRSNTDQGAQACSDNRPLHR